MAQATTVTPLDHLVKVLKLGEPSAYRNHTYINGESMYFPTGRVYGGQVIAQSVIAASKTVGPSRLRHVTPTVMLRADKDSAEHDSGKQMVWMKADGHVDVPQVMHRAMLALGCDQVMMEPVLRRAGLSISTPGISYASIDHSMWWYQDIDINEWHLYVQDTPIAAHGRGLGIAKVYAQNGDLVAAIAQEAMVRVP